jgi:penicillin-binding protein 1A
VFADDGELIAEFYMENRYPVTLDRVPEHVRNAFLSVEDPRFYSHAGIDLFGVSRAMIHNIRVGRVEQGGSTITQQLAKLLFLNPERTYSRKIKEALLALQIEKRYSKDEILTMYMNQVYMGSGTYGIEAASRAYFGKSIEDVNISEGAMLAGIPQAPSRHSPIKDPERALKRRHHALTRMMVEGYITEEQMLEADSEPLTTGEPLVVDTKAPYLVEYIRQMLEDRYGTSRLYKGGLNIYTTLNLGLQSLAEEVLVKGLDEVDKRHPRKDGVKVQGGLLAIDPHTGHIKAMVGGTDYEVSQFNRCTQAKRQPGSAFKPIVFAAAMEKGYRPEDVVLDIPVSYTGSNEDDLWMPANFDKLFEGPVTLRRSLARSINVVCVRLLEDVGISKTIDIARKLGVKADMPPYLPLALGAADMTLLEVTGAYAALDNYGIYIEPTAILKITDRDNHIIDEYNPKSNEAVSATTAAAVTDMLVTVVQHGTGWKAKELGRPVAGKTGTTSDYQDAWFVGYIPSVALGVWVGHDDHKPIGKLETGSRAALPIWVDFMKGYIKKMEVPPQPFPPLPPPTLADSDKLKLKVDALGVKYYEDNIFEFPEESPSADNGVASADEVDIIEDQVTGVPPDAH